MKHRLEDDIARLAFGDLSGAQAERLRREIDADPVARGLLQEYREISDGLRLMPVPEHQLSTDRFRNALLGQGLRRPKFVSWHLAWIPVAAGVLGFVITQSWKAHEFTSFDPKDVRDAAVAHGTPSLDIEAPAALSESGVPVSPIRVATTSIGGRDAARRPRTLAGSPSRGATNPSVADRPALISFAEATAALSDSIATAVVEGAIDEGGLRDARSAKKDVLVIIGAESDGETGARKATEVSSASNVVVGG